ncbi:MAG: glycosyltransferase [Candidatus Hydrogenedentes bacterium]|nr:glycosyltransferase [Candidatus Hydrogenedentota bacterium]
MESVAIVIPCLNEAANLESLLPRVHAVVRDHAMPARVYVVDGGSSDGTGAVAEKHGASVIRQRGTGYGGAIRTAFEDVHESYLITLDADCSHHPAILGYLYNMRHSADIVIASRFVEQGHARMPLSRRILSRVLNLTFRTALSLPFHDLSSGYRLYRRSVVQSLDLEYTTYAILQEILVKAYCEGFQIREIPFHYLPRRHGETHARLWRFGRDYLAVLRKMWTLRNGISSADYDNRAFNSRIALQRYWQRKRYAVIVSYIGDADRVLDTGCGSTQILNGAPQVIGCDILQRKLRFMRRPGRRLVRASTYEIPFRDACFDVVISSQVIEHIPDTAGLFPELARVVRPGGLLILGTPDYGGWQWPLIEKAYGFFKPTGYADEHITHYTRDGLFERLEGLGFTIEDHRYILGGELIIKARKAPRRG